MSLGAPGPSTRRDRDSRDSVNWMTGGAGQRSSCIVFQNVQSSRKNGMRCRVTRNSCGRCQSVVHRPRSLTSGSLAKWARISSSANRLPPQLSSQVSYTTSISNFSRPLLHLLFAATGSHCFCHGMFSYPAVSRSVLLHFMSLL
jgi:hypothetical protein